MYNRYIPQSDGSYRRRTVQDPSTSHPSPPPSLPCPEPEESGNCPQPPCESCPKAPQPRRELPCSQGASGFLKNLLPNGLDTEDLLILVLLLLISGDCREDRNLPLLTLALYLFL